MTLATEGEATDGDILSIKGGHVPEKMPMLTSHWNDPSAQLGSITDPVKMLKDNPPRLMALGHIEMSGEGVSAEIRRDLAHMIDKGHVTGVSIRWDEVPGKAPVRRVNLPSDHAYFVDAESEKDHRKRYGLYFDAWRAMEGSVVALGADPQALIGRSEDLAADQPEVSRFWRAMAEDVAEEGRAEEYEEVSDEARIAASLAGLRLEAVACQEAGASNADLINAVVDGGDADVEAVEIGEHVVFLPGPPAALVRLALEAPPEPEAEEPVSREEMEHLLERLDALEAPPPPLEEEREEAEPLPAPERVETIPLSAEKPLEAIQRRVAEKTPQLQAAHIVRNRVKELSLLEIARDLKESLRRDRREVRAKFEKEVERMRGKVSQQDG
jgi:hypothetical protein